MNRYIFFCMSLVTVLGVPVSAQTGSGEAEEWLRRSIAYHDPRGAWGGSELEFVIESSRPDGRMYRTEIRLDNRTGEFHCRMERDGRVMDYSTQGSEFTATLDGSTEISSPDWERFRLNRDDGMFWRNYFGFLLGLPMKLRDPGARLDPVVREAEFNGRQVRVLRVTYDPEVGSDTWYFYLDPETAALAGYRFYHDESAGDGEYILVEGEIQAGGLRLPRVRSWYFNKDDGFLGTDTLVSMKAGEDGRGE